MLIVRVLLALCLVALLRAPARAELAPDHLESELLHRRLDLTATRRWQRDGGRWVQGGPKARLLVVNLWAVECQPCVEEFPLLQKLAKAWRKSAEVRFVFVSETLDEKKMQAFWRFNQDRLPDEDPYQSTDTRLRDALETGVQPLTLIVDEAGVVRHAFVGSIAKRGAELGAALERLQRALVRGR